MNDEDWRDLVHPETQELLANTPIDALRWSVRARNCLEQTACETLWDIAKISDAEWMKVRNLGRKTLVEINEHLTGFIRQHPPSGDIASENKVLSVIDRELLSCWTGNTDPSEISSRAWKHLISDLRQNNQTQEAVGYLASKIKAKWPANRYREPLANFLPPDLALLWHQPGLGRNKIRVIVQCALALWVESRDIPHALTGSRAEALQMIAAGLSNLEFPSAMEQAFSAAGVNGKEREILFQRYGILDGQPQTLEAIGEVFGVTRERIRQIQNTARTRLIQPVDLRFVLESALRDLEPLLFNRLSDVHKGFVAEQSQAELLRRLGSWEGLLVELLHDSIDQWLDQRAERTTVGWVHGEITRDALAAAIQILVDYLRMCKLPMPLTVVSRETGWPEFMVRIAALHGAGWVVGDLVAKQPLRAKEQRVLCAHIQTRTRPSPVLKRRALTELFHPGVADTSFSPSTFSHAVGCYPQLLMRSGSEYVVRITPPWEITHPDVWPSAPPAVFKRRGEGEEVFDIKEEDDPDSNDDRSLYEFGFRLLQSRRLWRTSQLAEAFARASGGRYAATSLGQITVSHPRVQRFAPGVWGVKDTVLTDADYDFLLTDENCEHYIAARHARADPTPFSMWTPDMEIRWCRWAREKASREIFQSLLSVIEPDGWNCALPLREHWKKYQRDIGRYRLSRPPRKSLAELPVLAGEFLAAVAAVSGFGGTSWIDLNVLHGRTVDSHRPASFLALLIALGVVEPVAHWQDYHLATAAAPELFRRLCEFWIQSPTEFGLPLLEFVRTAAASRSEQNYEIGWVSQTELRVLLNTLGKIEIRTDESEVPI